MKIVFKNPVKKKMLVGILSIMSIFCQVNSAETADIDQAIRLYTEGNFDKAKDLLQRAVRYENPENRQISFLYLALIEMAYQNTGKVDKYLNDLLSISPNFDIEKYSDIISPNFKSRFDKIKLSIDNDKPTGSIYGIQRDYFEGETVHFSIETQDNKSLASMLFEVKDTSVQQSWILSGKTAKQSWEFKTEKWKPRIYPYRLIVSDHAGNTSEISGSFELKEKPDTSKPTGVINGIGEAYTEGDTIEFSIYAEDNILVKSMMFEISGTSIRQTWEIDERIVQKKSSVSTHGLPTGIYHYTLSVKDHSGNIVTIPGTFVLNKKLDITPPKAEITGILSDYSKGQPIELSISASDNTSLQLILFEINNTPLQIQWKSNEKTALFTHTIQTDGMTPDDYSWSVSITDSSNNTNKYKGSFILHSNPQYGYLDILTNPWTDMYINDKFIGKTPKAQLKLPAGKIDIRFINESKQIDVIETLVVKPNEVLKKSFVFHKKPQIKPSKNPQHGYLNLLTKPWTKIYINGEYYGTTPKAKIKLPIGNVTIRFINELEGVDVIETITILPDQLIKKSYTWKK